LIDQPAIGADRGSLGGGTGLDVCFATQQRLVAGIELGRTGLAGEPEFPLAHRAAEIDAHVAVPIHVAVNVAIFDEMVHRALPHRLARHLSAVSCWLQRVTGEGEMIVTLGEETS
jgi:hypothetical protein